MFRNFVQCYHPLLSPLLFLWCVINPGREGHDRSCSWARKMEHLWWENRRACSLEPQKMSTNVKCYSIFIHVFFIDPCVPPIVRCAVSILVRLLPCISMRCVTVETGNVSTQEFDEAVFPVPTGLPHSANCGDLISSCWEVLCILLNCTFRFILTFPPGSGFFHSAGAHVSSLDLC